MNKKAFSMIEILISVSIIIILAIVATTTSNNLKNNSNNSKVVSDLNTIENALVSFKMETNTIAMPGGNNNNFDKDWVYSHSFTSTGTFWVYGKFTENTLEKRFLDIVPLDPRTNQYYSYGITKDTNNFELAWVIWETDNFVSKVVWDYQANGGIHSLIREYNGPNFISDKSSNLPYNPDDRVLVATDSNWNVYKEWETITNNTWSDLEIFFSDWSTSLITDWTVVTLSELDFPKENNLVSKVNLFLQAWSIWTKATKLDNESSFDIYTSDMTASVRWTVFKVEITTDGKTEVTVLQWKVEVSKWSVENWDFTIIDTLEVNELPNGDLENTEVIDSVNETIDIINLIDTGISEIEFNNPSQIITITQTPIKEIWIKEEIQETYEPKNCYLESVEIKNGESRNAYKEKYVEFWSTCSTPKNRLCRDWVLDGTFSEYKYANPCYVKQPNKCTPYTESGFIWGKVISKNSSYEVEKIISIEWGETKTTKEVQCNDSLNYDIKSENIVISCDSINWFQKVWNLCECEAWKISQNIWWTYKCVTICDMTLWNWECVLDTLNETWYTLKAYAWFNDYWDYNLYKSGNIPYNSVQTAINWNQNQCEDIWYSRINNSYWSYCTNWTISWVVVENFHPDNNDFIKYWWLNLSWDFAIEINVFIKDNNKRYLINNPNFNLYTQDWKLYFSDWSVTKYIEWISSSFNKIFIKREWWKIYLKIWGNSFSEKSTFSWTLDHFFLWSRYTWSDYIWQIDHVIDYIKIYTK